MRPSAGLATSAPLATLVPCHLRPARAAIGTRQFARRSRSWTQIHSAYFLGRQDYFYLWNRQVSPYFPLQAPPSPARFTASRSHLRKSPTCLRTLYHSRALLERVHAAAWLLY